MKLALTLKEECILRVFKNSLIGKVFGPKQEEVTTGLRKLHDAELSNLYKSSSINKNKIAWHAEHMENRNVHMI
jgi:hypothetical protein